MVTSPKETLAIAPSDRFVFGDGKNEVFKFSLPASTEPTSSTEAAVMMRLTFLEQPRGGLGMHLLQTLAIVPKLHCAFANTSADKSLRLQRLNA
ncbi:hypothetical protein ACTGJ9_029110 [Bradyrhizobium sp. RDM12]